jgi:hypothetical protein
LSLSAVAFGFTYSDHAPLIPLVSADFRLDDLGAGLLSTALSDKRATPTRTCRPYVNAIFERASCVSARLMIT